MNHWLHWNGWVVGFSLAAIGMGATASVVLAQAQIPCQPGTVRQYTNTGGLAMCLLRRNARIMMEVNGRRSSFPCLENQWIQFHEDGNFASCILSERVEIWDGNSRQICNAEEGIGVTSGENPKAYCE